MRVKVVQQVLHTYDKKIGGALRAKRLPLKKEEDCGEKNEMEVLTTLFL